MMRYCFRSGTTVCVVMAGCLAAPLAAVASGTAVVQTRQDTATLSWQTDGPVRLGRQGQKDYVVVRDGKPYTVTYKMGGPVVMEMGGLVQGLSALTQSQGQYTLPDHVNSVRDLHKVETIAGIQGHVYQLNYTDTQGKAHVTDAVLTDQVAVVDMSTTYLHTLQALMSSDSAQRLASALPAQRRGILRIGQDFTLQSISTQTPPASQFALPAKPTNLQNLLEGLQGLTGLQKH
ncbi:hypothetical protein ABS755_10585 [Castellaniella sp. FW104-16D08]|uniref:hypothetical protein n=1 Tax=unclassified Castellaniella TaxID=2617606 RepID=UPI0033161D16